MNPPGEFDLDKPSAESLERDELSASDAARSSRVLDRVVYGLAALFAAMFVTAMRIPTQSPGMAGIVFVLPPGRCSESPVRPIRQRMWVGEVGSVAAESFVDSWAGLGVDHNRHPSTDHAAKSPQRYRHGLDRSSSLTQKD